MTVPVRVAGFTAIFQNFPATGGGGSYPSLSSLPTTWDDNTISDVLCIADPWTIDTPFVASVKITAAVDGGVSGSPEVSLGLAHSAATALTDVEGGLSPGTWEGFAGTLGAAGDVGFPFWLRLLVLGGTFHQEVYDVDPVTTPGLWDAGPGGTADHPAILTQSWSSAGSFSQPLLQLQANGGSVTVDDWFAARIATGPATITIVANPDSIPANGHSISTLTATVRDADDNPLSGEAVVFSVGSTTDGAAGSLGPVIDNHDGTYTCAYTSGELVADIDATASVAALSAETVVHQTNAPNAITVSATPDTIVADGVSRSTVTAVVKDNDGNPVAGETVVFSADSATVGAAGTCGPTADHGDGTYTCTYTDTTVSGDVTITATDGPLSATCVIHQTPTAVGNMGFGPPQVGIVRQGRN